MTDDDHDHHVHGAAFQIPSSILSDLADQHDRRHMATQTVEQEIQGFIDDLDPGQLIALRRILNLDNSSCQNNFMDGQVVSLLRCVHKVDPITGRSAERELELLGDPNDLKG